MENLADRLGLITSGAEEVLTEDRLRDLLRDKEGLKGYIGVEPSGFFHIGWMIWAKKFKDLMDAGVDMIFLEATWHAWINEKLGGSMENIQLCARYLEHCLKALGVPMEKVKAVRADELISEPDYWSLLMKVAKGLTLSRVKRALTIMGRREREASMDFSMLLYPCLQVTDIFHLGVDICLGGMDQRKAHVLAIELSERLGRPKPVAIHTPLLVGLGGFGGLEKAPKREAIESAKMSKSKPETCIFIHDSPEEVEKKLLNAFCPPDVIENNPVMEIAKLILFSDPSFSLEVERARKMGGGSVKVLSFQELTRLYLSGEIHPLDLKRALAKALNERLEPVRRYFSESQEAHGLYEALKKIAVAR
ncbi:MAG: tyrosine--tRNA ligase [Candidatus Bathyarchaeia archaeon]